MKYDTALSLGIVTGDADKMKDEFYLLSVTENSLSYKPRCADEKAAKTRKWKNEALTKKFIGYGGDKYIPEIIIDIDKKISSEEIKDLCEEHKIPYPNFIVHTTKGVHIHWVLSAGIFVKNTKQLNMYRVLIKQLVKLFDGDPHGVMVNKGDRIFRNPLKNPTTVIHTKPVQSLYDFARIIPAPSTKAYKRLLSTSKRATMPRQVVIESPEGTRNVNVFEYLRRLAIKYEIYSHNSWFLEEEAKNLIRDMENPLPEKEVMDIVASIVNFMETKYTGKGGTKAAEYNRKLAKNKKLKVAEAFYNALYGGKGILSIWHIKRLSKRKGGAFVGVSPTTFLSYRNKISKLLQWFFEEISKTITRYVADKGIDAKEENLCRFGLVLNEYRSRYSRRAWNTS
jgi:hypothetical protein